MSWKVAGGRKLWKRGGATWRYIADVTKMRRRFPAEKPQKAKWWTPATAGGRRDKQAAAAAVPTKLQGHRPDFVPCWRGRAPHGASWRESQPHQKQISWIWRALINNQGTKGVRVDLMSTLLHFLRQLSLNWLVFLTFTGPLKAKFIPNKKQFNIRASWRAHHRSMHILFELKSVLEL